MHTQFTPKLHVSNPQWSSLEPISPFMARGIFLLGIIPHELFQSLETILATGGGGGGGGGPATATAFPNFANSRAATILTVHLWGTSLVFGKVTFY